ncbi:MAG: spermidine/putrescine ABC transporter substrate-binding protein [Anaerolineae bacterium]|nr:spermidine/putrescine ABC transporter substrate-binding protein [Anaerolineae bacterium]
MFKRFLPVAALMIMLTAMLAFAPNAGSIRLSAATPAATAGYTGPLDKELNIYNWADYIEPDLLKEYQQQYGVKINYDNYGSDEEMLAKLQAGESGYDIVFPSDYMIARMIELGLLAKLDKNNIPNLANIDPQFIDTWYDPGTQYCVPYQVTILGITYLSTLEKAPDGWGALFDPEQAKYYSEHGGINLLDNQRDLMGAALMYLGYSYNETDPAKVAKARDTILGVKQYIHAINATDYQETLLIPREVAISQAWSGDALKAALATEKDADKGTWKFIIPKEGSSRSNDGACVLASSKHKATAEHFINFITEAKNAARVSNFTKYYSPNKAAREFIEPVINNFMPDAKVLDKLQVGKPLDEKTTKLYDDTWTEIRAGQ